jgi:hypothetical protein
VGEEEKGEREPALLRRRPKKTSATILKSGSLCSRSGGRRARARTTTPTSLGHQGAGATQAKDLEAALLCFPCFLFTRRSGLLHRTSSLSPRRRVWSTGEHHDPPSPCCGPDLRAKVGPRLVSLLFACCPLPACAATQTHRHLRAGHRAEQSILAGAAAYYNVHAPCFASC